MKIRNRISFPSLWRGFLVAITLVLLARPAAAAGEPLGSSPAEVERGLKEDLDADPKNIDRIAAYVRFLSRQDRADEAILFIRSIENQDNPKVRLLWAEVRYLQGETDRAREAIRSISVTDADAWRRAQELLIGMDYLAGDTDACSTACARLLARDPLSKTARLFQVRLLARRGRYEEADKSLTAAAAVSPDDIEILECRAELLDAQGKYEDAQKLRESLIERINESSNWTAEALAAAAAAMRSIHQPRAAKQCLEPVLRYSPADPFFQLEKTRLFRAASSLEVAGATASKILARYKKCPAASFEIAATLYALKRNATIVKSYCRQSLAGDPAMLPARSLLIRYDLIAGDWAEAEKRLAENRKTNAADPETERLARAFEILNPKAGDENRTGEKEGPADAFLAALLGEVFAGRGDYAKSLFWFRKAVEQAPKDFEALKGAGFAAMRCGNIEEATGLFERAFAANRFDPVTVNILSLLEKVHRGPPLAARRNITVSGGPREALLADYTLSLTQQYLDQESRRFGVEVGSRLHVHLCSAKGDLEVVTQGIPSYG